MYEEVEISFSKIQGQKAGDMGNHRDKEVKAPKFSFTSTVVAKYGGHWVLPQICWLC